MSEATDTIKNYMARIAPTSVDVMDIEVSRQYLLMYYLFILEVCVNALKVYPDVDGLSEAADTHIKDITAAVVTEDFDTIGKAYYKYRMFSRYLYETHKVEPEFLPKEGDLDSYHKALIEATIYQLDPECMRPEDTDESWRDSHDQLQDILDEGDPVKIKEVITQGFQDMLMPRPN